VISAATRVFADKGFARTQMADVARELRMSPGALYGYAESKDALFHWCIEAAADRDVLVGASLPLPAGRRAETIARVRQHLDDMQWEGALAKALMTHKPDDAAVELCEVVGELYDGTYASRHLQAIIERSAQEMPELFDAYYHRMRRPVIGGVAAYLQMRMDDGYIRPLIDVPTTARLVIETVAWFARHRRGDPDSADIDDSTARATVIDVLRHGLLPIGPG
jgi:AcrR family transcriptional regulator